LQNPYFSELKPGSEEERIGIKMQNLFYFARASIDTR